jgi:hypothetical protein
MKRPKKTSAKSRNSPQKKKTIARKQHVLKEAQVINLTFINIQVASKSGQGLGSRSGDHDQMTRLSFSHQTLVDAPKTQPKIIHIQIQSVFASKGCTFVLILCKTR